MMTNDRKKFNYNNKNTIYASSYEQSESTTVFIRIALAKKLLR